MPARRRILQAATALAIPSVARGKAAQVLMVVPQDDLVALDPVWNTSYQTRDHGLLVFDTLLGLDSEFRASPQMADGAVRRRLQSQALIDAPYTPLGQYFVPTAYQSNLTGVVKGSPVFWNVRRA